MTTEPCATTDKTSVYNNMATLSTYGTTWALFLCLSLLHLTNQEKILGVENEEFDFDGLPGAQHEFKLEISPRSEECFYQQVAAGANIHVSFEVLRASTSDRTMDVFLKDPTDKIIKTVISKTEGSIELPAEMTGVYSVCIDNRFTSVATKLVYVYIVTFVAEEWSKYVNEIEELTTTVTNFTHAISEVEKSVTQVKIHQAHSRMNVMKDWYLITGINTYITRWSIGQIAIIIFVSIFTVYFVRRLFSVPNVTPSTKPRA